MAIKIKFDSAGQPEKPTFVLAKKSGEYIGVIKAHQIVTKNSLTDGSEITFKVYKEENGEKVPITQSIISPSVEGAIITAEGAGNATVKTNIIQAVEAVTGVATHKIQVFEMSKE